MKCIGYKDDQIEFDFQIFEIHLSIIITFWTTEIDC